jgi:uncharacterized protein (DUF1778 family)
MENKFMTKNKRSMVEISPDTRDFLKIAAAKSGTSIKSILDKLAQEYIKQQRKRGINL